MSGNIFTYSFLLLIYVYSFYSGICRPSDRPVERSLGLVEIRTRESQM